MVFGKTSNSYDQAIDNIDDLLAKLTDDEIRQLSNEIDSEGSMIPPSDLCPVQTTKTPSGPFNHEKLSRFLNEIAISDPDWDESVPFEKKNRGRAFENKTFSAGSENTIYDPSFDVELDESLKNATNAELLDLASIIDFANLPDQFNARASLSNKSAGVFEPQNRSKKMEEILNVTDIEDSISKLSNNDVNLTILNLNNMKNLDDDVLPRLCAALSQNTILKELHMCATNLNSALLEPLLEVLRVNKSIQVLNLASNFLTGPDILNILKAISVASSKISQLSLPNQFKSTLGARLELEILNMVVTNPRITKLGLYFSNLQARNGIDSHLSKNMTANKMLKFVKK